MSVAAGRPDPRDPGHPDQVYLDHAASTRVRPEAVTALVQALELEGNPASIHRPGRQVRRVLEAAREDVADWAGT
ncbi:MAG: aminotransferase class V-fold PLP-dependent enzyme, partial [Candidatus Nanopelagicales bacterium]|nr:aminotransferase class V-fold PLP-dependent enzyme [Candidatus Nanopelagicales bacterium]